MESWSSGYVTDLDYTRGFYRELTPALLHFICLTRGIKAPDIHSKLAYCELGCGQGVSANLISSANPQLEYYAIDINPDHITGARELAAEAEISNVHFYDRSFAEILEEPGLPAFDIIALHGVYSWVSAEARLEIVEFIKQKLKPGGLVYISYNALPGWSPAAPLRHLMYLHFASGGGSTATRIGPALEFVDRIIQLNGTYVRAYPSLKERFQKLKTFSPNYLAHEYFNAAWAPLYHSDVASDMSKAKLSFVASAAPLELIPSINFTAEQKKFLDSIDQSPVRETVCDFLVNQQFRRDVFVRGRLQYSDFERKQAWLDQRFALSTPLSDIKLTTSGALGEAKLMPEVYTPLLESLALGPRTVRQMMESETVTKLGPPQLQEALTILTGMRHIQPSLRADGEANRRSKTNAFNAALMKRSLAGADLTYLASPVTGGAISADRFIQLFLLAHLQKNPGLADFAWNVLKAQGQRIVKEGNVLQTPEENLAELRRLQATFSDKSLPMFKSLGIV